MSRTPFTDALLKILRSPLPENERRRLKLPQGATYADGLIVAHPGDERLRRVMLADALQRSTPELLAQVDAEIERRKRLKK